MEQVKPQDEILELERKYWDAVRNRDVPAAVALTDFPCLIAGGQGVRRVDKALFSTLMLDPKYAIRSVEIGGNVEVRLLRDDVAVIAYQVNEQVTSHGQNQAFTAVDCSTWVRRDGKWRCAAHSETALRPGGSS